MLAALEAALQRNRALRVDHGPGLGLDHHQKTRNSAAGILNARAEWERRRRLSKPAPTPKEWPHEGTVAGDRRIISTDGHDAHYEPPSSFVPKRRMLPGGVDASLAEFGFQPIQGGTQAISQRIMERVRHMET